MEYRKLIKEKQIKYIECYEILYLKEKYIVEVLEKNKTTEFWLSNVNYGIKDLMFGLSKYNMAEEEIIDFIDRNIEEYIKIYRENYKD